MKRETKTRRLHRQYIGHIVSSDTMRDDHIIRAITEFCEETKGLKRLAKSGHELIEMIKRAHNCKNALPLIYHNMLLTDEQEGEVSDWIARMFGELNRRAPSGSYFGAAEGDGALYGFWEDREIRESKETRNE